MATVFRDPVIAPISRRPDNSAGRTFIATGFAILTIVALPPGKSPSTDHLAKRTSDVTWQRQASTQGIWVQAASPLPPSRDSAELPKRPIDSKIARDWWYPSAATIPVVNFPLTHYDWPLSKNVWPKAAEGLALTTLPILAPIAQPYVSLDWSLPKRLQVLAADSLAPNLSPYFVTPAPPPPIIGVGGGGAKVHHRGWKEQYSTTRRDREEIREALNRALGIIEQTEEPEKPLLEQPPAIVARKVAPIVRQEFPRIPLAEIIEAVRREIAAREEDDDESFLLLS